MRSALVWGAYPLLVFGSLALVLVGLDRAWLPAQWLGSVVVLGVGLAIVVLEQLLPDRRRRVAFRTAFVDVLHNLISSGGTSSLVRALAFGALVTLGAALSRALGTELWPADWSLLAQLTLAVVLGELGSYWAHRLMHISALLWRVHALHHSPPHLYLLASGRTHPLNALLVHGCQMGPVIFLGAGVEVIALAALFTAVTGLLQHCNIEMETRWLNWLIATPDLHRTHHSVELEESNSNFGNNLILWDIVFGTRLPNRRPAEYGVSGVDWPESYLGQLATPFIYERISQDEQTVSQEEEPVLAT